MALHRHNKKDTDDIIDGTIQSVRMRVATSRGRNIKRDREGTRQDKKDKTKDKTKKKDKTKDETREDKTREDKTREKREKKTKKDRQGGDLKQNLQTFHVRFQPTIPLAQNFKTALTDVHLTNTE
jgi:hypothetical protein